MSTGASGSHAIALERGVPVRMRDGTVLAADVWRPAGPGRHPVLLQRTPYDKALGLIAHAPIDPARAVEAGYAVVIQDVRGRFASEGRFDPFRQEVADGADTIAWTISQPWSSGWVAMYGSSYVGATQLLAARGTPPGLQAIAPFVTGSEYYEGWTYQGGAFQLGFALMWARGFAATELARRGDDPALRDRLDLELRDPWPLYTRLPLDDQPHLRELASFYLDWLAHPTRDAYWTGTAINGHYERIQIPALHMGGWNDIFLEGTLANYAGMSAAGAPAQRLVVGPWGHGTMGDMIGDVEVGPDGSRYALGSSDLHLAFFDQVRSGGEPDGPPVRLFVMGPNRWRDEDDWPLARATEQRLYLRAGAELSHEPPAGAEEPDTYVYDPRDPVPTAGGPTLLPGHELSFRLGPRDQSDVERRTDVLVYTSEPLPRDLEVTGRVELVLHAASSAPDTDWTAKLVDVRSDGKPLGVVDGILRARFRDGLEHPELLEPGRPYRYLIVLGSTSSVFRAGHRVRLEVSSSNFPRFDRNPNTGSEDVELRAAHQTVFHDVERASYLVLPVVE
jgi:putative CocE/NonD family hydrolase